MITVVSGLPRSGTSLMMQMLAASGVPIQTDGQRVADHSNARGYYEWERIKQIPREPAILAEAEGKAVKVISSLLLSLNEDFNYKIIFMERNVNDVAASQRDMIASLGAKPPVISQGGMLHALTAHRDQVLAWIASRPHLDTLRIIYSELLENPYREAGRVSQFLGLEPNCIELMASQIDPSLCHHNHIEEKHEQSQA